jgi:hypothetical protein
MYIDGFFPSKSACILTVLQTALLHQVCPIVFVSLCSVLTGILSTGTLALAVVSQIRHLHATHHPADSEVNVKTHFKQADAKRVIASVRTLLGPRLARTRTYTASWGVRSYCAVAYVICKHACLFRPCLHSSPAHPGPNWDSSTTVQLDL